MRNGERVDGRNTHCGVDGFEMLKIDGRSVMANAMWTVEPEGQHEWRPRQTTQLRPAN